MDQNKVSTRDKIVAVSIKLFESKSYEDVSVKDICDAAGVTRNSFYYYFDSKELLFDAIGDWISRTAKDRLLGALSARTSFQQLWQIYRMYEDVQVEVGPEIMNHVCASRTLKGRSDYYSYVDTRLARTMKRLIQQAQEDGEVKNNSDPDALLWASYALIRGVNIKWCFQWGESDIIAESIEGLNAMFMPNPGFELT